MKVQEVSQGNRNRHCVIAGAQLEYVASSQETAVGWQYCGTGGVQSLNPRILEYNRNICEHYTEILKMSSALVFRYES